MKAVLGDVAVALEVGMELWWIPSTEYESPIPFQVMAIRKGGYIDLPGWMGGTRTYRPSELGHRFRDSRGKALIAAAEEHERLAAEFRRRAGVYSWDLD